VVDNADNPNKIQESNELDQTNEWSEFPTDNAPNTRHEPQGSRYGRIIKPTTRVIKGRDQAKTCNYRKMTLCCTESDQNENVYVE